MTRAYSKFAHMVHNSAAAERQNVFFFAEEPGFQLRKPRKVFGFALG
jgi:hypothetical protein